MIDKSFIEKIESMSKKNCEIQEIDGMKYSAEKLNHIIFEPQADTIELNSLNGFCDFIKDNKDNLDLKDLIIHIESQNQIYLLSKLNGKLRKRDKFITVKIAENSFPFERYIDKENFVIKLMTMFVPTADREILLQHLSKVVIKDGVTISDDGMSQNVNMKTGISGALKEEQTLKPIITLRPYRTFLEIEQPESMFLFRMRKSGEAEADCALFQADGGLWVYGAKEAIKKYLLENLAPTTIMENTVYDKISIIL